MSTINYFWRQNAQSEGDKVILKVKQDGAYRDITWRELEQRVNRVASGLLELGLAPGEKVALLGDNTLQWTLMDLASLSCGAVTVPIYPTSTAEQAAYILENSESVLVAVQDSVQLQKVLDKLGELPRLSRIIVMNPVDEGLPAGDQEKVLALGELERLGQELLEANLPKLAAVEGEIDPEQPLTIVYTSGTTGPPKGCLISHKNIINICNSIDQTIRLDPAEDISLLILPLSHLFPRASAYFYSLYCNIPLAYAESTDTIAENLQEIRPTYFISVPRIYEKVYERIIKGVEQGPPLRRRLFYWSKEVGTRASQMILDKQPLPASLKFQYALARALVFKKLTQALGGRLRFCLSGGAPLAPDIAHFIHAAGVTILEFYGLTETIGGTVTTPDEIRFGTVGKPQPGIEVKLAGDGEVMIRGNNFLGYYKNPEATSRQLRDGWFYTGDIGEFDSDGFLKITDRKKDLIITAGGKNISPQNIENLLKSSPCISNAMVHGDRRKYLTALVTLDGEYFTEFAREHGLTEEPALLAQHQAVSDKIASEIELLNEKLARFETIKKFAILPGDFTLEGGELTPTLKLKRNIITERYRELIDSLYRE